MKSILPPIFFMSLLMLVVQSVWAGQGSDRLQAYMREVKTLRADFSQTMTDETGNVQAAKGTLWLQRPGRFRWSYTAPSPQVIVADGVNLWLHDIELEQVIVQAVNKGLDETPAMLLGGDVDLNQHFAMQELGQRGDQVWLELTPHSRDGHFKRVRLGFADADLVEMEVLDNFGQTTVIRFEHIEHNLKLDPALFTFTPPTGVDVVGTDSLDGLAPGQ